LKRRYKCFCEKSFFELTKEELKVLIREQRRRDPKEVLDYYKIDIEEYCAHIKKFDFKLLREERERWIVSRDRKKERNAQTNERLQDKEEWEYVLDGIGGFNIPDFIVCALYDVSYEIINKKRYYDQMELERAKEMLNNKVNTYMVDVIDYHHDKLDKEEYSNLRTIDLVAMRMFRGYTRK
jgi:hypothetical protein